VDPRALNRMAEHGPIVLSTPRNSNGNGRILRHQAPTGGAGEPAAPEPVTAPLAALGPQRPRVIDTRPDAARYRDLVATHHYLGYTPLAGAQLRHLVDSPAGVLAALAFATSAWRCAARDGHLGWDDTTRASRLHLVVGNARFLILPHVRVPQLTSAVLGAVTRRLPIDWQAALRLPAGARRHLRAKRPLRWHQAPGRERDPRRTHHRARQARPPR